MGTPEGELHFHNGSNGYHLASSRRFSDEDLVIVMLANERNTASVCLVTNLARAVSPQLAERSGLVLIDSGGRRKQEYSTNPLALNAESYRPEFHSIIFISSVQGSKPSFT